MRATRQMSVTLPYAMADAIRARVRSGEYASESEVIREGMRALAEREKAIKDWLYASAGPIGDETAQLISVRHARRSLKPRDE